MKKPGLLIPLLFACACILSITVFGLTPNFLAKGMFALFSVVFGFFFVMTFIDYAYSRHVDNQRILLRARANSEMVLFAEIIRDMSPDHMKTLMLFKPTSFMELHNGESRKMLKTGYGDIPYTFIKKMLLKGSLERSGYLYPSNGQDWTTQNERDYADWLTKTLCFNRFAVWPGSNTPARWIEDGCARFCEAVELYIDLPEDDEEETEDE